MSLAVRKATIEVLKEVKCPLSQGCLTWKVTEKVGESAFTALTRPYQSLLKTMASERIIAGDVYTGYKSK